MEHGIHAIARLLWWSEQMRTPIESMIEETLSPPPTLAFPRAGNWSEAQTRTLLQEANIPVTPGILATSADEAVQAARTLGLPVALKVQSAAILHKSEVGGVALHLDSEAAVEQSFHTMMKQVQAAYPVTTIDGLLVSPMRSAGTELLVGIIRDPLWGLVLTLGLGGIWTEVLKDTAIRVLPTSQKDIETMLGELRGIALLRGERGQLPADLHAVSAVIQRISVLAQTLGPQLTALEINPLWVQGSHVEALDALLIW
jgi:acyl-CoA synthetase (NDP forming)